MRQDMSVLISSASQEWGTPVDVLAKVRAVFEDRIDLDPASSLFAQRRVNAKQFWTLADDTTLPTLSRAWVADHCFLNPPYGKIGGKSSQGVWAAKLEAEFLAGRVKNAILLVNSNFGYKWWEELWPRYGLCLLRERLRFVDRYGVIGGQAKSGSALVLFTKRPSVESKFQAEFASLGRIFWPEADRSVPEVGPNEVNYPMPRYTIPYRRCL